MGSYLFIYVKGILYFKINPQHWLTEWITNFFLLASHNIISELLGILKGTSKSIQERKKMKINK